MKGVGILACFDGWAMCAVIARFAAPDDLVMEV
jgi:hypothetical protein